MYMEIKTNNTDELLKAFTDIVKKGQESFLTFCKDGDFYTLSTNTTPFSIAETCGS
jgi:hypothetical protein